MGCRLRRHPNDRKTSSKDSAVSLQPLGGIIHPVYQYKFASRDCFVFIVYSRFFPGSSTSGSSTRKPIEKRSIHLNNHEVEFHEFRWTRYSQPLWINRDYGRYFSNNIAEAEFMTVFDIRRLGGMPKISFPNERHIRLDCVAIQRLDAILQF
jgi:hypothetical protein